MILGPLDAIREIIVEAHAGEKARIAGAFVVVGEVVREDGTSILGIISPIEQGSEMTRYLIHRAEEQFILNPDLPE